MLTQNSRCLAFHGPLLYEAKILAISEPGESLPLPSAIAEAHSKSKGKAKSKKEQAASNRKLDTPEVDQRRDAIIKSEDNIFADSQIDDRDLIDKRAYFIHYKGWKSTWDEWVTEDRVLEWTDENLRTQRELKQQALQLQREQKAQKQVSKTRDQHAKDSTNLTPSTSTQTRGKSSTVSSPAPDDNVARGVKRAREGGITDITGDVSLKRAELTIQIPDQLKALLVDDWEYVTKNHQLVTLPRSPTVAQTISQYKETILSQLRKRQKINDNTSSDNNIKEEDQDVNSGLHAPILTPFSDNTPVVSTGFEEILDEFLAGVRLYFDRCLGNMLLYRFERQQFLEWTKKNKKASLTPSQAYGPEHLLRLFVSLPDLISQTNMDPQSVQVLKDHVTSFLWYLVQHKDSLFQQTYENTSPAYEALSRGL